MTLAIDIMDGHGLSNKAHMNAFPGSAILVIHFIVGDTAILVAEHGALQCTEVSGHTTCIAKHSKTRLGSSFTVRISA